MSFMSVQHAVNADIKVLKSLYSTARNMRDRISVELAC